MISHERLNHTFRNAKGAKSRVDRGYLKEFSPAKGSNSSGEVSCANTNKDSGSSELSSSDPRDLPPVFGPVITKLPGFLVPQLRSK
jgi:hypothetical protein